MLPGSLSVRRYHIRAMGTMVVFAPTGLLPRRENQPAALAALRAHLPGLPRRPRGDPVVIGHDRGDASRTVWDRCADGEGATLAGVAPSWRSRGVWPAPCRHNWPLIRRLCPDLESGGLPAGPDAVPQHL